MFIERIRRYFVEKEFNFEELKEEQAREPPLSVNNEVAEVQKIVEQLTQSFDVLRAETEKLHGVFNELILRYARIEAAVQNNNYVERASFAAKRPVGLPPSAFGKSGQLRVEPTKLKAALSTETSASEPAARVERGEKDGRRRPARIIFEM